MRFTENFDIVDNGDLRRDVVTLFEDMKVIPVNTKITTIGKVYKTEKKYTSKREPMEEIYILDSKMMIVKVTTFGKIPQHDRRGLRPGRVLEVTGVVSEKCAARYIAVGYNNAKHEGCRISVLAATNTTANNILSQIGKKKKVRGNVSQAAIFKTISEMKNLEEGLIGVKDCVVLAVSAFKYTACAKCKTSKRGEACRNDKCTSKSKKEKNVLGVNVTIKDSSEPNGVRAVMFGHVGSEFTAGIDPEGLMRKPRDDQNRLLREACLGKQFQMDIYIRSRTQWVIQYLEKVSVNT